MSLPSNDGSSSREIALRRMGIRCGVLTAGFVFSGVLIAGPRSTPRLDLDSSPPRIEEQYLSFTTTEFTEPTIDVSNDGSELYFNVLGEIFKAPISGGTAMLVPLGEGWKERPMLSPDGQAIAFLSDRDGEVAVWRQSLAPGGIPVGEAQQDRDVTTAAWVANDIVVSSGIATTRNRPYSLKAEHGEGSELASTHSQHQSQTSSSMSADNYGNLYLTRRGSSISKISRATGLESVVVDMRDGLSQPRVSRDGTLLGYVVLENDQARLVVQELSSGTARQTGCLMEPLRAEISGAGPEASYAFLPDKQSIVLARGGKLFRCYFGGETSQLPISVPISVATTLQARPKRPSQISLSRRPRYLAAPADLSQIAFTSQGHLWLKSAASQQAHRMSSSSSQEHMAAFSPAGTELAYAAIDEAGESHIVVRVLDTGKEKVLVSSKALLLNPTWSSDGRKIAFIESNYGGRYKAPHRLRWVNREGYSGDIGEVDPGAFRYFPVLTWNSESTGIFYTRLNILSLELISHVIGSAPQVLLETDSTIWDIRVSPSGRYVAFQDKLGLSIAPFSASAAERPHYSASDIETANRVAKDGADYFQWVANDRLVWSAQENVYVADPNGKKEQIADLSVPRTSDSKVGRTAYVGARAITMSGLGVLEDALIITSNNKIEYVGPRNGSAALDDATVVDISGKTVMPGIVDVHTHFLRTFEVEATAPITRDMFATLAYGVTTVFDPSGPTIDASVRSENSQSDEFTGPTYYGAGLPLLGAYGSFNQTPVRSYEEALHWTHLLARAGALMVKEYLQPTRHQRRWLADAAKHWGLGVTAHEVRNLRVPLSLVVDGYTGIEHNMTNRPVRDDVKQFLVSSGIAMTPTLGVTVQPGEYLQSLSSSRDQRARCLIAPRSNKSTVVPSDKAKLQLISSSDFVVARDYADILNRGGNVSIGGHGEAPGLDSHWEMQLLEMAGAKRISILQAATVNGAKKLGMENHIGSLAAGMDADFVVLNSNPLDGIKNTLDISRIVRRGRTVAWPMSAAPPGWVSDDSWQTCKTWNLGLAH